MAQAPALRHRFERWRRGRESEAWPVRIHRRRVYVLPTRFGLFYGVATAVMLAGALNYNNNPALMLALLLAGAGLASLVYAHLQLSGIEMTALTAAPVHAGEYAQVRLEFAARDGRARNGLGVRLDGATGHGAIDAAGQGAAVVPVHSPQRGWQEVRRVEVNTQRPLGLATAWTWAWPGNGWLVYPALEPDGPPLPEGSDGGLEMRATPTGDELRQLREHQAADGRRAVAWKASARAGTLLAREFEQQFGSEVVLDFAQARGLPYEQAISRMAHWVELAEQQGRRSILIVPSAPALGPASGVLHAQACMETLARMPAGPG